MAVDAVIFDWGGTLTPWHTVDLAEQWRVYARAYDPAYGDEVAAALRTAEDDAWRVAREEHRSTTFAAVVRSAGLEPSGRSHARALEAYHAFWEPHTFTDPDAFALLAQLRERQISIGVLSNTIWARDEHEAVFRRDGVLHLIDGAVYTSEIEWTKPHPEAFIAAMKAVGVVEPEQCVFVGDRPFDDIYGAGSVGMRTILLPHSQIPDDQRGPLDGEPDAVITKLSDVLSLVDGWQSS